MSSIKHLIIELQQVNNELKRVTAIGKQLRKQSKSIESEIIEYLEINNQPGVKYNGTAIIVKRKSKRATKKNKDKDNDAIEVLKDYGIDDPERVLKQLLDARKGDEIEENKIDIKTFD